jgi:succinoglycan biosynthesis protein ExoM
VAEQAQSSLPLDLLYCVEPQQNIALARNKALANAQGEFVAFIDDDELPGEEWLLKLFQTCESYQADGVLGPVLPRFEQEPPAWVTKGGFCDRPLHETGFIIDPNEGRTGNLLLKKSILAGIDPVFLPEFGGGGEDRNFFKRMIEKGHRFVWCNEAAVDELVPPLRCKRSFMLRRALLRGKMSSNQHGGAPELLKSIAAIAGYGVALPILFFMGQHFFMKYLIKICDHAGKLLAVAGLNPIRESYILE